VTTKPFEMSSLGNEIRRLLKGWESLLVNTRG
jgi:hypothetical protein